MPTLKRLNGRTLSIVRSLTAYSSREKQFLLGEMVKVKGLMPLLMKPRNKQRWSGEDKAALLVHLKRLSQLSPYLVVVVMPGGFFVLPVIAWWLDRRRTRARNAASPSSPT
jgi:hypothetical protein